MSKITDVLASIKERETLVGTTLKDVQNEVITHYKRISKLVQGGVHPMVNAESIFEDVPKLMLLSVSAQADTVLGAPIITPAITFGGPRYASSIDPLLSYSYDDTNEIWRTRHRMIVTIATLYTQRHGVFAKHQIRLDRMSLYNRK